MTRLTGTNWALSDVHDCGHLAEMCVIDDEFDLTVYHLSFMEPKGATNMPMNSAMMCVNKSPHGA